MPTIRWLAVLLHRLRRRWHCHGARTYARRAMQARPGDRRQHLLDRARHHAYRRDALRSRPE